MLFPCGLYVLLADGAPDADEHVALYHVHLDLAQAPPAQAKLAVCFVRHPPVVLFLVQGSPGRLLPRCCTGPRSRLVVRNYCNEE